MGLKMKYFSSGHRESYTLIARKRYMKKIRQHQTASTNNAASATNNSTTTWHGSSLGAPVTPKPEDHKSPEQLKRTTCDLFELLEKAQRSRIDDQRCMLPAYFNQQQQQERERERREKERREMERRENERRERERELLLHQQRLAAAESAAKQTMPAPVIRDRSPLRNGQPEIADIRVKEEPRAVVKEEDLLARTDPRYHPYLRHPSSLQPPPPSALDRSRMLAHTLPPHYPPPPTSHWPPPTTMASDPFYRYGYNPLMESMRPLDERAAAAAASYYGAYGAAAAAAHHPSQLRSKEPSLLHLRGGPGPPPPVHKMSATPPTELHKKEEPR